MKEERDRFGKPVNDNFRQYPTGRSIADLQNNPDQLVGNLREEIKKARKAMTALAVYAARLAMEDSNDRLAEVEQAIEKLGTDIGGAVKLLDAFKDQSVDSERAIEELKKLRYWVAFATKVTQQGPRDTGKIRKGNVVPFPYETGTGNPEAQ